MFFFLRVQTATLVKGIKNKCAFFIVDVLVFELRVNIEFVN